MRQQTKRDAIDGLAVSAGLILTTGASSQVDLVGLAAALVAGLAVTAAAVIRARRPRPMATPTRRRD